LNKPGVAQSQLLITPSRGKLTTAFEGSTGTPINTFYCISKYT